jgi:uncharacterized protein (UPF0332 family)
MLKQSEKQVREYLENNMLYKEQVAPIIIRTYVENAQDSLRSANVLRNNSSLWTIVTSYYAMFYITNAVLGKLGYKVGELHSHEVTKHALHVFIANKLKKELLTQYIEEQEKALSICENLLENFGKELHKRHQFQYDMTLELKQVYAQTSLQRAKEFVDALNKLL